MVYYILSFFLLIIFKFIYDTFLTNNGEKKWEKYRESYPHKAAVIENNKGFNLNTNAEIRTDGYYLAKIAQPNTDNVMTTLYFFLLFTKKGFVCYKEIVDIIEWRKNNPNDDIRDAIMEVNEIEDIEISPYLTNYKIKNGGVNMKFFDINNFGNKNYNSPKVYNELYGSILHNGLLLSFDCSFFSFELSEYEKRNFFKNVKFNFIKCQF